MTKKATRKPKGSPAQRSAPKRKASSRPSPQGKGNPRGAALSVKNPDAAGIDVGARVHYVAVPEDRAQPSIRSFGAYTAQLEELVQWLQSCGIKTVALESTGVYRDCVIPEARRSGL
jgi:transposase